MWWSTRIRLPVALATLSAGLVTAAGCSTPEAEPAADPAHRGASRSVGEHREPVVRHHSQPPPFLGRWYLEAGGQRLTVAIEQDGALGPGVNLRGTIAAEAAGAPPRPLEQITFEPSRQRLAFRERRPESFVHYRLDIVDGVTTGRYAQTGSDVRPTDPTAFGGQVVGWHHETFDADIFPRVFDLTVDGRTRAVLRIDQSESPGGPLTMVGRFKIYATNETLDEQLAEDVLVEHWDGRSLRFARMASTDRDQFVGLVSGRTIAGSVTNALGDARAWTGQRVEVLTHGFAPRSHPWAAAWQERTRRRLALLAMAGNPAPLSMNVAAQSSREPHQQVLDVDHRDDSAADWPQAYRVSDLAFTSTLPNPNGGAPLVRTAHGVLAVPTTPRPPQGYPVAVALNGHWGSAAQTFDPHNVLHWYGDGFARRGYVVIAVDVSHRPVEDRAALYGDMPHGDDPGAGNGPHPAIKAPGMNSDWEEDGERTWDVMRALDHVLARTDVDHRRVTVLGLSMGGEVAQWVGAMDRRVTAVVSAAAPPDLAVMPYHGNHPCWDWLRGKMREFVDPGDLDALVAPRLLVRETGREDRAYSNLTARFASAKQVVQRVQPMFDVLGGRHIHYLHYDVHTFHVGEMLIDQQPAFGVTTPMVIEAPASPPWSIDWQTDQTTQQMSPSLFDELAR